MEAFLDRITPYVLGFAFLAAASMPVRAYFILYV